MLMRFLQVTREGKRIRSNVPRQLIYGTMVYVRKTIVSDALSRAVCIAARYSAVRRQFGSQNGGLELQRLQASDFSTLPEAHACTAELKSLATSFTRLQNFIGVLLLAVVVDFPSCLQCMYLNAHTREIMLCSFYWSVDYVF